MNKIMKMTNLMVWTMSLVAVTAFAQPMGPGQGRPGGPIPGGQSMTRLNQAPLPAGTVAFRNMPYVTNGHQQQKLDLYIPREGKDLPLIILVHGGAFMMGSKEGENAAEFVADGYAVASINYRLSQDAIFPAQIQDCKAAVRWLRANAAKFRLAPDKFGAFGASAGGNLVAMLGTTGNVKTLDVGENLNISSTVQAVVDFFGPTDFLQMDAHRLPSGQTHNPADSPESRLIGGPIQENKDKVAKANPITYVTAGAPPFFIAHGDCDPMVPHHQSELLVTALQKANVQVSFYTVKGAGHSFQDATATRMMKEFFTKHLKSVK